MYKIQLLALLILIININGKAQNSVGISDNFDFKPDNSAILHLNSANKGFLMPTLSSTQISDISNPALGLIVFDTKIKSFMYWDSLQWVSLNNPNAWGINGNNGILKDINFFGTIDAKPIEIRTNNAKRGYISETGQLVWGNSNKSFGQGENAVFVANGTYQYPLVSYSQYNAPSFYGKILETNTTNMPAILGEYASNYYSGTGVQGISVAKEGNGIYGMATGIKGKGIYGYAPEDSAIAILGSVVSPSATAGMFNGNVQYTGQLLQISDENLKKEIKPMSGILSKINNINAYEYYFDNTNYAGINMPQCLSFGFLAQELQNTFPNLVNENNIPIYDGNSNKKAEYTVKTINYTGIIPVLLQAIKEQQEEINNLKVKLERVENLLNNK